MKKTALVLALISVLLFLVVGVFFVNLVKGNAVFSSGSIVLYTTPVYHSSTITVHYVAEVPFSGLSHKWIVYSLDGGGNVTVYDEYNNLKSYYGSVTLSGLSSGLHTIDIYSKNGTFWWGASSYRAWGDAEDTASFTIDLSGKSPIPTPTIAPTTEPTPTLEPTPFEETGVQNTSQFMVAGGAVALVSIIVFLGLLVYFIKRR